MTSSVSPAPSPSIRRANLFTTLGFTPTLGQTFVVVDNDDADPVVGTFSGLPEGATINLNANQLQISYVGGSGNDIVLTVVAAAKTWTGAVNNLWSNPGNWQGGVPGPGDPLVFPAGASNIVNIERPSGSGALQAHPVHRQQLRHQRQRLRADGRDHEQLCAQYDQRRSAGGGIADHGRLLLLRSVESRRQHRSRRRIP